MATHETNSNLFDLPSYNVVPSFSFSGCGFLGVYHVGVAACLRDHTDVVNRKEIKFAGASAGAIVATTLLCDIDFGEVTRLLLKVAWAVRNKEHIDLAQVLRDLMNKYLPDNAHELLSGRLYISVTMLRGLQGALVTDFHSKEHLIECLIATSFIPGFLGWIPPGLEGEDFVDIANGVLLSTALGECCTTDSESASDEDDEVDWKQDKNKKTEPSSCSIWDVYSSDYNCNDCRVSSSKCKVSLDSSESDSYLNKLVKMCFRGLHSTTQAVRKIPVASHVIDSFIPDGLDGFIEALMLEIMSNRYTVLDGGFSDNIPCFDNNTITICPFAGESDICPRDLTALDISLEVSHTSLHISEDNIFRLNHALNPMDPEMLLKLCEEGYNECLRFLHKKDLLSCKKHLMTRAAISSSPCNIGHAHCKCRLCQAVDPKIRTSLSCTDCHQQKRKALNSVLPADVRNEFDKAIADYNVKKRAQNFTHWNKFVSSLWWCVEKMYAGTIRLTDLSIDFHMWLLRVWDNIACFTKYAVLPLGKKRKLVRYLLHSLKKSIGTARSKNRLASCTASPTNLTMCI
ncbi:uncharacterized protein LOC106073345 isoform X1 [Biomphalaria glabrata]|uniref:Uncharacterized protein LOC106073345 isoform X1 n=1 Tax=Biomphalaria glabrata TaxID=6526 RepID=A0A2C9JYS7_BIOGL|nr:uncharacterized protein LOC106073345 isoform X1 [Biomphalaria glabrata]